MKNDVDSSCNLFIFLFYNKMFDQENIFCHQMTISTAVSVLAGVIIKKQNIKTLWLTTVGGLKLMGSKPSCEQAAL